MRRRSRVPGPAQRRRRQPEKRRRGDVTAHPPEPDGFLRLSTGDIQALYDVSGTIGSLHRVNDVVDLVVRKVAGVMRADAAAIRLRERGRGRFLVAASCGPDQPDVPRNGHTRLPCASGSGQATPIHALNGDIVSHSAGELISLYVARHGRGVRIADLRKDRQIRYSQAAGKEGWRSLISMPLFESGYVSGTLDVYKRQAGYYRAPDEQVMGLFACQTSVAIRNARLFEEARRSYINTIRIMASIIDAKDSYMGEHSERVMNYAMQIAEGLGLSDRQLEIVRYASFLHDIGKIGMEAVILRKPGPLDRHEWEQIKMHPLIGADIVGHIDFLSNVVPTVLHHHARFGGGGYPDAGLKVENIPLEARILTIADSFEAMISARPYRQALSRSEAIGELKANSGTQFDPDIVRVFLRGLGDIPE